MLMQIVDKTLGIYQLHLQTVQPITSIGNLGANIDAKILFLYPLTGCDSTSSINEVGKATKTI